MRSRDEIREERRRYEADCDYEAYRRGMGDLDRDRMFDAYYDGASPEKFVSQVRQEQIDRRNASQQELDEQAYYEELERRYNEGGPNGL